MPLLQHCLWMHKKRRMQPLHCSYRNPNWSCILIRGCPIQTFYHNFIITCMWYVTILKLYFEQAPGLKYTMAASSTDWGRDKINAIVQTTFSNAISWMKMFESRLKFHWSLFLKVQLKRFQHWFRKWLGAEQATSHYLNQWWLSSMTHICVTWPQWVNHKRYMIMLDLSRADRELQRSTIARPNVGLHGCCIR